MLPFAADPAARLTAFGEEGLLTAIRRWLGPVAPASPFGMGDDTAVLRPAERNLFTSDSLVYGRHFDATLAPEAAGAKLLKRNLSDLAAMGGLAREAVLAAFLPPQTSVVWLERFTRGLAACADAWDVTIVGGDLTQTDDFLGFNLSLLGHCEGRPLLRHGARPSDRLWVTGSLGGSLLGKHHQFLPRLSEGAWLGRQGPSIIRALIDVTDGLAKDLPTLLPPGSAILLDPSKLPHSEACRRTAEVSGRPPTFHTLNDGEDYELLFATAAEVAPEKFAQSWREAFATPLTLLGPIIAAPHPSLDRRLLDLRTGQSFPGTQGYEHFGKT